jgi:adenosylcobinamide-GDP ribazoletransferase
MAQKGPTPPPEPSPQRYSPAAVLAAWWRDLRVAAAFLTRLPLDRGRSLAALGAEEAEAEEAEEEAEEEADALARSTRAFPLVGLGVGAAGGLGFLVAEALGLGPLIAALVALAVTIALTGALHEDGLADVADGLGGGRDPEAKLAIMRDSRTGPFGVLALVLSVALRAAALAALATSGAAAAALIAAAAGSRAMLPVVMDAMEPAKREGLAAALGRPPRDRVITAALLGAALVLLFLGPVAGVLAVLVGAGVGAATAALAWRQLRGYTGDVLGAIQQASEVAILLTAAALV